MSLLLASYTIFTKFINTRIMFNPISSLVVTTRRVKSWLKRVGRNVISVVKWMACSALRILQVSPSEGIADGFRSNNLSACTNKLNKCWSFVFIVDAKLKAMVKMGFWPSTQFISGPAFWKNNFEWAFIIFSCNLGLPPCLVRRGVWKDTREVSGKRLIWPEFLRWVCPCRARAARHTQCSSLSRSPSSW